MYQNGLPRGPEMDRYRTWPTPLYTRPGTRAPDGNPKFKYFRMFVVQQVCRPFVHYVSTFKYSICFYYYFPVCRRKYYLKADRVWNCALFILRLFCETDENLYCRVFDRTCCSWSLYAKVWSNDVLWRIYYSGYLTSQQRNKHNTFEIKRKVKLTWFQRTQAED